MDALTRQHDERLHSLLTAELSRAGCFRPAAVRSATYGTFIVAIYGAAYAALLAAPSPWLRATRDRRSCLLQRTGGLRRTRSRPPGDYAQPAHGRIAWPGVPYLPDRPVVLVLPAHPSPPPSALQRSRARPGHAVGVGQHVPRVRAVKDRAGPPDQSPPGRADLGADRVAGPDAEAGRHARMSCATSAAPASISSSSRCTWRSGCRRRS